MYSYLGYSWWKRREGYAWVGRKYKYPQYQLFHAVKKYSFHFRFTMDPLVKRDLLVPKVSLVTKGFPGPEEDLVIKDLLAIVDLKVHLVLRAYLDFEYG